MEREWNHVAPVCDVNCVSLLVFVLATRPHVHVAAYTAQIMFFIRATCSVSLFVYWNVSLTSWLWPHPPCSFCIEILGSDGKTSWKPHQNLQVGTSTILWEGQRHWQAYRQMANCSSLNRPLFWKGEYVDKNEACLLCFHISEAQVELALAPFLALLSIFSICSCCECLHFHCTLLFGCVVFSVHMSSHWCRCSISRLCFLVFQHAELSWPP